MSMSTHVIGIRPPDAKWLKMKEVWDACEIAGVNVPDEVDEFFGGEPPDESGVLVDINADNSCCNKFHAEDQQGYEVDIDELPKDVKIVRFYNSW